MDDITKSFINSISGKPEHTFLISTNCKKYNNETFANFEIAKDFSTELKQSGYNANVLDYNTGEVLFIA